MSTAIQCSCGLLVPAYVTLPLHCSCGARITKPSLVEVDDARFSTIDFTRRIGAGSRPHSERSPKKWGPEKWEQLHRKVRTLQDFRDWAASIPCGDCSRKVSIYVSKNPFQEHNPWWGYRFHNFVNQQLSTPNYSEDEAKAKYGWN